MWQTPEGTTASDNAAIRRLEVRDETLLEHHVASVGWALPPGRLHMMLTIGMGFGYFAAEQLVASSILFPYGPNLAFLGMVIVNPDWQRKGLGSALVRTCLNEAQRIGITRVGLLATDMGIPLYASLGFVTADKAHRYMGAPNLSKIKQDIFHDSPVIVGAMSPVDWAEVVAMDAKVTGANRAEPYRAFVKTVSQALVARDVNGVLCGYGMATAVGDMLLIGPLHADDVETATVLAGHLMLQARAKARIDVPEVGDSESRGQEVSLNQEAFMRQLEVWGLTDTHVSPMMLAGGTCFPGARNGLYGIMDAALG